MSAEGKGHRYMVLDGLRGTAALMVILYHVFEGFATSPVDQHINHGYLAVDFFFILSGFVIGFAYDGRWKEMSTREFFRRRLVRLHPMVVAGVLIGAVTFLVQGGVKWDGSRVPLWSVFLAMALNLLMLPAIPGTAAEVRGNGEMFPLNGPNWSLFFEYVGNILYASAIRRLSTRALKVLVAVLGAALALFAVLNLSDYGHIGVGWTLSGWNFPGGLLRMLFSYTMGMLIARTFTPRRVRGAFWICSAILVAFLSVPHVGGMDALWMNGLYDIVCVAAVFPLTLCLGASGICSGTASRGICTFLGGISYPLYIVHYPFYYLFYSWVWNNNVPFAQAWPVAAGMIAGCILLAWLLLKYYETPVRRWLS